MSSITRNGDEDAEEHRNKDNEHRGYENDHFSSYRELSCDKCFLDAEVTCAA